jgi:hypothetical protein
VTATDRRRIPQADDVSAIRRTLDDLGIEYGEHEGGPRLRFLCPYCEQRPVRKGKAKDYSASMDIETTQWACWSMACTSLLRRRGYFQWDGDDRWRRCGNLLTLKQFMRRPKRAEASCGRRKTIREQIERALVLLSEHGPTETARRLGDEFGIATSTAWARIAAANGKQVGNRTDNAAKAARRRSGRR